jgi:ribosomal protein S18 acetylase RimI-like enzyme
VTGPNASAARILVREADLGTPAHGEAIVALLDAYARDPMGGGEPLPDAVKRRLIPELRRVPGALVLLAWDGEEPVGLAVCFPGFSTFRARPLINIHDLAVLPARRRRGVAGRLLSAVMGHARRRGCCKVTLEVREDNPAARRLYERTGFSAGSSGGGRVPHLFLEKRLP